MCCPRWLHCGNVQRGPDFLIYWEGRDLAENGEYDAALEILKTAANPNDPRILNYMGFATRKLGDPQAALVFYEAALANDPNYVQAISYMGEAFIALGDLDRAQTQLKKIAAHCGTNCEAYTSLEAVLELQ